MMQGGLPTQTANGRQLKPRHRSVVVAVLLAVVVAVVLMQLPRKQLTRLRSLPRLRSCSVLQKPS